MKEKLILLSFSKSQESNIHYLSFPKQYFNLHDIIISQTDVKFVLLG